MNFKIVILSANATNLIACVKDILRHEPTFPRSSIIVVDDGAMAGAYGDLHGVTWIKGVKPFNFARNSNLGISAAGDSDVILLNDDACLKTQNGLEKLSIVSQRDPGMGICSAGILPGGVGNRRQESQPGEHVRQEPIMLCFMCVYIKRATIVRIGGLDEAFSGYGFEDNDYCKRIQQMGLSMGIYDGCVVDHSCLQSSFRCNAEEYHRKFVINQKLYQNKWFKVYDVFLFNDEFELLRLRLEYLSDVVDKFVLIEHNVSMRGKPKPYHFENHKHSFDKWRDKIMHVKGQMSPFDESRQANCDSETVMRACADRVLSPILDDDDTVIFGDADEIPKKECIKAYVHSLGPMRFQMHFSYYFLNLRRPDHTFRSIISKGSTFKELGFNHMRWNCAVGNNIFNPGGWHFSFLGGYDSLLKKITTAAEGCGSDWVFKESRSVIEERIKSGRLYNGAEQYRFVPIDESFPGWIRDNKEWWTSKGMILES